MKFPRKIFLIPVGMGVLALGFLLWPVSAPPLQTGLPKPVASLALLPAASPQPVAEANTLLRGNPDGMMKTRGGESPDPPRTPEPTMLAGLSAEERARVMGEAARLREQFKELEVSKATVTFDGATKLGHLRSVRINEPNPEHLHALYDAGTSAVAKFAEETPAYEAMRGQVAELLADFSRPRVAILRTHQNGEWEFNVVFGSAETSGVPDENGALRLEGPHRMSVFDGRKDLTSNPKTERYWHLFGGGASDDRR